MRSECGTQFAASVHFVREPCQDYTRTDPNGSVRLVLMETGEPATELAHLVVLHPSGDPTGLCACTSVSAGPNGRSWAGIGFLNSPPSYDPAVRLTLPILVENADDGDARLFDETINVTIDKVAGTASVDQG